MLYHLVIQYVKMKLTLVMVGKSRHVLIVLIKELYGYLIVIIGGALVL